MEKLLSSLPPLECPSQINRHEVRLEGDILRVRFVGPYLPDEASRILTLADEIFRRHGRVFLLADVAASGPPGPETRRVIGTWNFLGRYAAVAFGASLAVRTVFHLVVGAQRALGHTSPMLTHISTAEPEARAWIDAQRRQQVSR